MPNIQILGVLYLQIFKYESFLFVTSLSPSYALSGYMFEICVRVLFPHVTEHTNSIKCIKLVHADQNKLMTSVLK